MKMLSGLYAIPAVRLVEILQSLPPGSTVLPNQVGNLSVSDASGSEYRGWICLREDRFEDLSSLED